MLRERYVNILYLYTDFHEPFHDYSFLSGAKLTQLLVSMDKFM